MARRTTVTEASEKLMAQHCYCVFEGMFARRKFTKDFVVNISALAAFVDSCVEDLRGLGLSLAASEVEAAVMPFVQNDMNFMLEISSAQQEKKVDFKVTDISYYKQMVQVFADAQRTKDVAGGLKVWWVSPYK